MNYPIERVADNWERRIIRNGYVQNREIYSNGRRGAWQFYVSGFDGTVEGKMDAVQSARRTAAMIVTSPSIRTTGSKSMGAGMIGVTGTTETKK